ncbi:putative E3 ubiquitin ligase [Pseudoloma neurophilia]|uniref:Putative E3 ubiquitin ligase n=1 Tax=Pseudoloma neurophilia TaxID=146866 RepID=A0A0R0M1Y8_9MICR|nr:putative E3 ubiquitin ligase [Pseudoloma neurophilia]
MSGSSTVQYRFKSSKYPQKVSFEGSSLPLWELRAEIIHLEKMTAKDFDLEFYMDDNKIENDSTPIYRNTMVIVRRIPLWMSKMIVQDTTKSQHVPKLPPNYICFRCGQKGHFIQHCPTNEDKQYDLLKIRKATGIPKDFLKPVSNNKDGTSSILVTKEGGCVQAQPQEHMFNYKKQIKIEIDRFICKYCTSLITTPVKLNCEHYFCKKCIIFEKCVICGAEVTQIKEDHTLKREIENFVENQGNFSS